MRLEPGESRRLRRAEIFHREDGRLIYRTAAAQDLGKRKDQQDSVACTPPEEEGQRGLLCVLSDGMGGLSNGREVSALVADTMISRFFDSAPGEAPERILLRGCAESQRRVLASQEQPRDRGATLAAVLIREGRCSFLSVGDSRILLFRGGGLLTLTRDQNKRRRIETQVGLGQLPPEARTDRTLRSLSMFIGREDLDRADRAGKSFPLLPGDRLLLVSDGVYEALSRAEMTEVLLRMADSPGAAANELISCVLEKNLPNQDNCTVAVLDCAEAP